MKQTKKPTHKVLTDKEKGIYLLAIIAKLNKRVKEKRVSSYTIDKLMKALNVTVPTSDKELL